jgi:signal transduction histidine kinase
MQTLFATRLTAETLPSLMEVDPEAVGLAVQDIVRMTRGAQAEMRALLFDLRPETLATVDLMTLLMHLAEATRSRSSAEITVDVDDVKAEGDSPLLNADLQVALYRIAQEALDNAAKYAHASHIGISLKVHEGNIELIIRDNGKGFDAAQPLAGHFGLQNMRERAAAMNGELSIQSNPGKGTTLKFIVSIIGS